MIHFSERLKLVNDTRHRICEEIRNKILLYMHSNNKEELKHMMYGIDAKDVLDILDQIEKGE